VIEEMVDSFYFTQMLPENNIVVSTLSAKPEGYKTQIRDVCAKPKTTAGVSNSVLSLSISFITLFDMLRISG
jgi:hypothetical protein